MNDELQTETIKLSEIIDVNLLQELQDAFAKFANVASITVDHYGPITNPSNFTDFCMKYTRGSSLGYERCNKCDIDCGRQAAEKKKPVIYNCHSGLTDFAVPIVVDGIHVGSILGGQVLTYEPDESHFRKIAQELGIDEENYIEALRQIKIIPFEQVEAIAELLFVVASSVSEMAKKNLLLKQKNHAEKKRARKEILLRKIIEIARSGLDIVDVKQKIVNELGKAFNADRCYFRTYDKAQDKFFAPDAEYLASSDIKSLVDVVPDQKGLKYFSDELRKRSEGFYPVTANYEMSKGTPLEHYMKTSDIVADYAMPIIDTEEGFTWLVLHYSKEDPQFDDDHKKLLETIAFQVDAALKQIKFYESVKVTAERETLLRKITEKIRDTLNIDETLELICKEVTTFFNVQRTIVTQFSEINNDLKYIVKKEFKSNSGIQGLDVYGAAHDTAKYWDLILGETNESIFFNSVNESSCPEYFKREYTKLGVNSILCSAIKGEEQKWGNIILFDYEKERIWKDDEINFLNTIADQIYISIHQAELYIEIKKQAERELLLRKVSENIRSSLDINESLSYICDELAQLFNVQRATIIQYHKDSDYSHFQVRREYKSNPKVKGIMNNPNFNFEVGKIWAKALEQKGEILAIDNIETSEMPNFFKENYASIGQKSIIIAPIQKDDIKWGVLILSEYNYHRHWTEEDKNLIETISNQIYVAIHQSELYSIMKQQAEREKAILSNLPFMVWLKDKDSRLLAVNEPYAKMCGLPIKEIMGKTDYDFFPKELADAYVEDDRKVMRLGKTIYSEEVIVGLEGPRYHETYKTPLFDEKGEIVGTTGFSRDITAQKEVDKMKNEFVSMVSHELRTPLTSIRGSLGLVTSGKIEKLSDKTMGLLEIANNNCLRLINLINDILDIEKIEAGKMDFDIRKLALMPLVEQSMQANIQYAQKFNVQMQLNHVIENEFVNADPNRVIQVVTNLLSNAIKFSDGTNPVEISVIKNQGKIRVEITNYGKEISSEFKKKIFQKFAQGDSSDARQKGGTGLGLSISKAIIEKMQGNIGFESSNNKTTFFFELNEILELEPLMDELKDPLKPNILICEDDKDVAFLISILLKQEGYTADICYNADQAKVLLYKNTYEALLLDLILPGEDGLSLIRELRNHSKTADLPIIVVSVKASEGKKELEGHYAVFDWVDKPIQKDKLLGSLKNAIKVPLGTKPKVLHVEDDEDIRIIVHEILREDAMLSHVSTLKDAKLTLTKNKFDLLLLDMELPDGNGAELLSFLGTDYNKDLVTVIFSAHEVDKEISKKVDAVLSKSGTSNKDLLNIMELIKLSGLKDTNKGILHE